MRKFTAFAALGVAAALALTGCTMSGADGGSSDEPVAAVDTVNSDGAGLRAAVQAALYDHVYLAGAAINQALADGGDLTAPKTAAAVQALDDNSVAVAALIGSVYPDAEQPFLDSWRSHIPFFVDYTLGKVTNDQAKVDKAVSDLGAYAVSFGELIHSVVPCRSCRPRPCRVSSRCTRRRCSRRSTRTSRATRSTTACCRRPHRTCR